MPELMEYKCPHCGGKLEFDAATQNMKCPYCDSELNVEALFGRDSVLDATPAPDPEPDRDPTGWEEGETDGINVYVCNSCGGEIVADETTGATHCPYCGNPVVMKSKFSGALKPDCIIPFSVTKEQAMDALRQFCKGKKLLPKIFSADRHLSEIKGVYVPFWLFDAMANGDAEFRMTNIRTWSDSTYRYTETSHYEARRGGSVSFHSVPVDGATKMPDAMMESIEPYDASQVVPFQTAYLSGYLADKYDVTADQSLPRAKERMKTSLSEEFEKTVTGYATVKKVGEIINVDSYNPQYALYPVWLLSTAFEGKNHLFAVNGQTGKIVGDLPIDEKLEKKYKWIYGAVGTAVSFLIGMLVLYFGGGLA